MVNDVYHNCIQIGEENLVRWLQTAKVVYATKTSIDGMIVFYVYLKQVNGNLVYRVDRCGEIVFVGTELQEAVSVFNEAT